ncbi:unnamed protein product [Effrenium voratum]|nr:unnamed protein product [Effrenium voratum]
MLTLSNNVDSPRRRASDGSHLNSGQRRRTETLRRVHEKAEEGRSTRRLSLEMLQGEPSGTSEQEGNPDMHTSVEEELTWQQALLLLLEEPSYGLMARLISYLMILAICGSIATFVMESEPTLEDWEGWFILEAISTAIFTVEYLLRLAVCNAFGSPTRLEFIRTTMNVVDVIAILPFFLELITRSLEVSGPLAVLRVLRLVRIFRIFRLSRYSLGMSVMISSLAASIQPLIILVFFLCIGGTLFSSLMYYAERMYCPDMEKITPEEFLIHQQECKDASWDSKGQRCCDEFGAAKEFTSIMDSTWWCVVTMTTVGYGDKVPATKLGQFVGGMTILSGIVLISLPVAIVGSRFQRAYEEAELEQQRAIMDERDRSAMEELLAPTPDCTEGAGSSTDLRRRESSDDDGFKSAVNNFRHNDTRDMSKKSTLNRGRPRPWNRTSSLGRRPARSRSRRVFGTTSDAEEQESEDLQDLAISEKVEQLHQALDSLRRDNMLTGAAKEQIRLLLALLEHLTATEEKLKKLKSKDLRMEARLSHSFSSVCRSFESNRRLEKARTRQPTTGS